MTFWWWNKCLLKPIVESHIYQFTEILRLRLRKWWTMPMKVVKHQQLLWLSEHRIHAKYKPRMGALRRDQLTLSNSQSSSVMKRETKWSTSKRKPFLWGVIWVMQVHYLLSPLMCWGKMSWQKQLKVSINLAHSSRVRSFMVDCHGSSSLRQLVALHPQSGSRGRWILALDSLSYYSVQDLSSFNHPAHS